MYISNTKYFFFTRTWHICFLTRLSIIFDILICHWPKNVLLFAYLRHAACCDVQYTMPQTLQPSVSKEQRLGWVLCPLWLTCCLCRWADYASHTPFCSSRSFRPRICSARAGFRSNSCWNSDYPVPDREERQKTEKAMTQNSCAWNWSRQDIRSIFREYSCLNCFMWIHNTPLWYIPAALWQRTSTS